MAANSKIEWTHHTFNPWWGCVKVSPGCAHCYAETFAKFTGNAVWGAEAPRRFFGEKHWAGPLQWNAEAQAAGERRRVFCASMADVFEEREDLFDARARLFTLIEATPHLQWLLLTKRPENIRHLIAEIAEPICEQWDCEGLHPENVWLGTTAEDQDRWDERVGALLSVPAAVHFVSAEPLLGPIQMGVYRPDWLIVGGESGPGARSMDPLWVEDLHEQCDDRTAFFFKQWGGVRKHETGRLLDGREWNDMPTPR